MANYTVVYPICGTVTVSVEADSKKEAIDKGWDHTDDKDNADVVWEPMTKIVEGNVFWGESNNIEVYEE